MRIILSSVLWAILLIALCTALSGVALSFLFNIPLASALRVPLFSMTSITAGTLLGALFTALMTIKSQKEKESSDQAHAPAQGCELVTMPDQWNEARIAAGIQRYKHNPGMLSTYFEGIRQRYIMGQSQRTIEVRIRFLERFNEYAAIARESYKWQRYMKGGRAKLEEDVEDLKAEVAIKQVRADLELAELDKEMKRHEKLLQIEKLKREIADLGRPAPEPPSRPSASEVREQKRRDLKHREERVLEEMRITRINPTLSAEQKQRKLNGLEDQLAQIHEEQAALL